jgi:hypothetical protein
MTSCGETITLMMTLRLYASSLEGFDASVCRLAGARFATLALEPANDDLPGFDSLGAIGKSARRTI